MKRDTENKNYRVLTDSNEYEEYIKRGYLKLGGSTKFGGPLYLIKAKNIESITLENDVLKIFFKDKTFVTILLFSEMRASETYSLFFAYLRNFLSEEDFENVKLLSSLL